jgi:hypothetical protein
MAIQERNKRKGELNTNWTDKCREEERAYRNSYDNDVGNAFKRMKREYIEGGD